MQIFVLGSTQARQDDGTPVQVGGARLRALLTVLAVRAGRTVPAGALVDEVWGERPPADAPGALQALVARLRRALGAGAVVSADGGYRLGAGPEAVDLHRFGRLAAEGARALEAGEPGRAVAALDEALALWRGPALADLPDPVARAAEAAPWEARRLTARRSRLAGLVALGRAEEALPELAALEETYPLDEPLRALRIRALAAAGRPAEALAAYETVRRDLAERLGADPGPELKALHTRLLDPEAAGPERGPAPVAPAAPVSARPVPDLRPGNLRARLTSFVGREEEIGTVLADLAGSRLVTLLGPGGAGKTRLSQEAAERGGTAWPDGVWLAELAPVRSPEAVPDAVLTALGARQTVLHGAGAGELRVVEGAGRDDALVRLAEHCARRRMLLLLDNCEHLSDAAAALVQRLLEECPGLSVLATSREPLGVPGETLRPVGPLPGPAALELLAERGASARPGFRVEDDPEACAEICRRLDGLPLAIELAAARLRMLTPRGIADRLDDRFRLLTGGSRTVLPRQQTLRAVVDWSWELLADQERAVLRRLSVFSGGCGLAAAEAVCAEAGPDTRAGAGPGASGAGAGPGSVPGAGPGVSGAGPGAGTGPEAGRRGSAPGAGAWPGPGAGAVTGPGGGPGSVPGAEPGAGTGPEADRPGSAPGPHSGPGPGGRGVPDILDVLGSLVDKSLVVAAPAADGEMRYRLLETVAEYAAERLDEAGERPAAERRHLVHHRELARTTDSLLRGPGQPDAIARFQLEYENIRTALRRAVDARDEPEALCLVLSLAWYWQMRDLRADARHWTERAAALGPDPFAAPVEPAPSLDRRCTDTPPPWEEAVLDEARRGVRLIGLVYRGHETWHWSTGEGAAEMRRIATAYRPGQPQSCWMPGSLWLYAVVVTGDAERLRAVVDGTVDTCRRLGLDWELAGALQTRANILANRSSWAGDAARDAEESLAIFQRLGDAWGTAEALSSRAEARERSGDAAGAAEDYAAAVTYAERIGARGQVALLRARYAQVLTETGRGTEAEEILRDILERDGDNSGSEVVPAARLYLVGWLARTGRTAEARRHLDSLDKEFRAEAFTFLGSVVLGTRSWLDNLDGRHQEALAAAAGAYALAGDPVARMVAPHLPAVQLVAAAWALAALGGPGARTAAVLLGAREELLPAGHVPWAQELRDLATATGLARTALGEAEYTAAYQEGRGLDPDEVAALLPSPERRPPSE
ncbi:winged helix-turn-helix domain-containing protein [Streptomyces sp. LP05-1]|uniref:Winged helix-turn-helix domain-containing protein n=1 Tax=Streptomyces pyxinae TaxID=2970734 RepID=A0ABT2CNB4_9ACTN|nr:BTAD domain-containing putative transcriptional regulator [Streptomyces sp. LP05-1]MCS0638933.1 winged helix-turn-helix domain-containing protein [Streptomyces sp. LP05-1]